MRFTEAIGKGTGLLAFGGVDRKGRDARLLMAHALGVEADKLVLEVHRELTDAEWDRYHGFLTRRLEGEPVSRIIGRRAFWGRDFQIDPQVLDPRPETETLIAALLTSPPPRTMLDLGTGSGILAITLAAEWPGAQVTACDLSPGALAIARRNAEAHEVAGQVSFIESDWFERIEGRFDLIVSNPPYIALAEMAELAPEVAEHDPRMALTDEGDGLGAYRAIIAGAPAHLTPGGRLMVEIGWKQGRAVEEMLGAAGFEEVLCHPDLDGRDRAVSGVWPGGK